MSKSRKKRPTIVLRRHAIGIPIILIAVLAGLMGILAGCGQANEEQVSFYIKEDTSWLQGYWGADATSFDQSGQTMLRCWAGDSERLAKLIRNGKVGDSGDPGFVGGEHCDIKSFSLEGYEPYTTSVSITSTAYPRTLVRGFALLY